MTRSDNFKDLLQAMIDFANETAPKKRHRLFGKILTDSYRLGLIPSINMKEYGIKGTPLPHISFPDTFNPDTDLASKFQVDLIQRLFELKNGIGVRFGATLFNEWWGKEKYADGTPQFCLYLTSEHTYNQFFTLLLILLFIIGYQAVKHCPGCNKFFVQKRRGKIDQLTCSNTCRQRVFKARLKEEEAEINKKIARPVGADKDTEAKKQED